MTYSPNTPAKASMLGGVIDRLRRAEDWLDSKGRGAWIATTVLGLVFVWPVGLALLAYVIFASKWRKTMFLEKFGSRTGQMSRAGSSARTAWRSSGNTAFDAYKADTLRRLEDEQHAFESFLDRLRDAKDKQEFDSFMQDRAKGASRPVAQDDTSRSDA